MCALLPFNITVVGRLRFPEMFPQTTDWTIKVHTCPEATTLVHVTVVLVAVGGHVPQLDEMILYDKESHPASTADQLKVIFPGCTSMRCTSLGGGRDSTKKCHALNIYDIR